MTTLFKLALAASLAFAAAPAAQAQISLGGLANKIAVTDKGVGVNTRAGTVVAGEDGAMVGTKHGTVAKGEGGAVVNRRGRTVAHGKNGTLVSDSKRGSVATDQQGTAVESKGARIFKRKRNR